MEERINQEKSWVVLNIIRSHLYLPSIHLLSSFFLSLFLSHSLSFFLSFFLTFLLSSFPPYLSYFLFLLFFLLISYFSIFHPLPPWKVFTLRYYQILSLRTTNNIGYFWERKLGLTLVITEIRKFKSTKRFLVFV